MKRIVISGTYCTGKTTLSRALSYLTGIPCTHAPTMREILPRLYPSKTLRDCSFTELLSLGMVRYIERANKESGIVGGFISDGCPLQEWVYGTARLHTGAYPDETAEEFLHRAGGGGTAEQFRRQLAYFGKLAREYVKQNYDVFFHLPVEFGFVADGHRPTSEAFRHASEAILLQGYREAGLSPVTLRGSLRERLLAALSALGGQARMEVEEAMALAERDRRQLFDSVALEGKQPPFTAPLPRL